MDGPGCHYVTTIGMIRLAADRELPRVVLWLETGGGSHGPACHHRPFIIWAVCDTKLTESRVTVLLALSALFRDALPITLAKK